MPSHRSGDDTSRGAPSSVGCGWRARWRRGWRSLVALLPGGITAMAMALPAPTPAEPPVDAAAPAPVSAPPLVLDDAERAWLAAHPHLRVVTKTEWAPIDLYTYEGQFRGLSGDYLALISQRLGVTFDYRPVGTLAAGLEEIRRGDADIVPSVSSTPQREAFMDFTQPYLDVPNVYVARRGVRGVGPGQSMAGLRVAVEQGYAVATLIRERHPRARIVEFADSAAALRGVSEDQADVYLGALPTTSFLVEKLLLSNLEVRGPWHSTLSALHLGVPKGETVLLRLLDKALANITLAERQAIHRRWAPLHTLLAEPSPPLALSADERRLIATLPALRVGYETDYRPYTMRTEDGRMAGMADDYLRVVADKLGLRIGLTQGGIWSDVYARARRGELDLLVAVAANEEREREFFFIGPWISTPNVLVAPRDAAPVISLSQYAGRRVAVLRDGQTAYLMRKLHPYVRLVEVAKRDELLAAVVNGQADAALVNSTFAAPALAEGLGSALKMAAFFPELNSDLYFAVRRDQPELAAVMRRALASMSEGERAAIASRWAVLPGVRDTGQEARATLQRVLPVFAVVLAALLVSVLWGVWLKRAVERRRVAERALAEERDRAERLARMRHDFLTEASHEIRTPVNAVVGALDQLGQQALPDSARELASLARRAAQTLSEYVNNLLDISKSDAGELKLVLQPGSLAATLQAAAEAIGPVARPRGVAVEVALDPALAARHVFDAFRLRQVVLNLLSNAVKFGAGGAVQLHAAPLGSGDDAQRVQIEVVDHGVGIPADRLSSLFRPYAQAGESLTHRSGSTGLGLALCKRLVDAMGGEITIASQPGRGTRVTVSLPLPVVHAAADAVPRGPGHEGPLRVLLADDDRVQQILIEAMLTHAGCVVDLADDGAAAQALWLQHRHRLVVSDLHMPALDGHALARWLRMQPGGAAVQLIGTSADLDADAALHSGFTRLLTKPVLQAALDEVVREARMSLADGAVEDAA